MVTSLLSETTGTAPQAVRFHLNLADRTETESVSRYLRCRQLAVDVLDAARRADATLRLERALSHLSGPHFA